MIKKLTDALLNKDFAGAAELFAEDGKYTDYCASLAGADNWFLYGKGTIEMFLRNKLCMGSFRIFDPQIIDETHASFYAGYSEIFEPAIMEITVEDGKIKKASVRPE